MAADLDDYFIPDRNPAQVRTAYAELLSKHIAAAYEGDAESLGFDGTSIQSRLFTQAPVFNELVRASEGVPRDFINIFVHAYFDARRRGRDTIDMEAVTTAARKWYEEDKRHNLSDAQASLLQRIMDEVIGNRKARCFMLEQQHADHPLIKALYDLRVIHRLRAGYSSRSRPGVRYNVYALDYGTYVDLRNTGAAPNLDFTEGLEDGDAVEEGIVYEVPFDDHRSIRQIILDPRVLEG